MHMCTMNKKSGNIAAPGSMPPSNDRIIGLVQLVDSAIFSAVSQFKVSTIQPVWMSTADFFICKDGMWLFAEPHPGHAKLQFRRGIHRTFVYEHTHILECLEEKSNNNRSSFHPLNTREFPDEKLLAKIKLGVWVGSCSKVLSTAMPLCLVIISVVSV